MLKSKIIFLLLLLSVTGVWAQENLYPLSSNPRLQLLAPTWQNASRSVYVENNMLVESDTLELPFVDEFSSNTLRPYGFEKNAIYDSILYSFGPCNSAKGVSTSIGRFHLQPTYTYYWDSINKRVDSVMKSPITFLYYSGTSGDCFRATPQPLVLYPEYTRPIFDSAGKIISNNLVSSSVNPDTIITYARVLYLAKLPPNTKWFDNYAYVNRTYPIQPPTIGVATLDGLNQYGLPYNKNAPNNYGVADYLTTKPLNTGIYSHADSLYLSFYYQPMGMGNWPNRNDSLVLEFKNGYTDNWDRMWSTGGLLAAPVSPIPFKQVILAIPKTVIPINNYFYKGFQFRFKNYASLAGNNDHWHIDYVRLAANRNAFDTVIQDVAFCYDMPSILKRYTSMPAWNFVGQADIVDTISATIANNNQPQADGNNPPSITWTATSEQVYPTPAPMFSTVNTILGTRFSRFYLFPSAGYGTPALHNDSVVLHSRLYFGATDALSINDTISHTDVLTNCLAYDDGSAEMAYGLEGLYTKKAALKFSLNQPDTLLAFQIHYSNIDVKVEDLIFTFDVWDKLQLNEPTFVDSPIYSSTNKRPYYIDSVNGMTTYRIEPLAVPKDFYFGWSQTDDRNLQVGYDRNSDLGRKQLYIFTNGTWKKSSLAVPGSPMIRLFFRKYNGNTSGISQQPIKHIKVYPNPTNDMLYFDIENDGSYTIEVLDAWGNLLKQEALTQQEYSLNELSAGMYFLRLKHQQTGEVYQNKIVKQ